MVALYDARFPNGGVANDARRAPAGSAAPCGPRQRDVLMGRQARRIADLEAERDLLLATIDDLRRQLAAHAAAEGGGHQSAYGAYARRRALQRVLMQRLLAIVARHAGIDLALMASDRRGREAAWPRQMFCFLARERCPALSLPAIGAALDRDHSSVIHAVRAVQRRLAEGEAATVALYEACAGEVGTAVAEIAARMPQETGAETDKEALTLSSSKGEGRPERLLILRRAQDEDSSVREGDEGAKGEGAETETETLTLSSSKGEGRPERLHILRRAQDEDFGVDASGGDAFGDEDSSGGEGGDGAA